MPELDTVTDDISTDENKDANTPTPTLDQIHQISQAKVEEEDANNEDSNDDNADDTTNPDKTTVDGESKPGDKEVVVDDDKNEPAVEPKAGTDKEADKSAVELDSDTTKPGAGKVAIKNADGVTHYFNNLSEVPEDFEPVSYKALMIGTEALLEKKQSDAQATKEAEVQAEKQEQQKRTDDLQKSWEKDAEELTTAGLLPKGDKAEAAREEVYAYIEAQMKENNIITSFKQAYKQMNYDKQQAKIEKEQKANDDAKKKRGGIVQPGSGGVVPTNGPTRGKVIQAPPSGAGLDAVHAHVTSNL